MHNQKALQEYYNGRGHFGLSFATIKYANFNLNELALKENVTVYSLKKQISATLLSKNFLRYLKFIFKKFYELTWLFIFIPAFIVYSCCSTFYKI